MVSVSAQNGLSNAEHMVVEYVSLKPRPAPLMLSTTGELVIWEKRLHAWLPCIGLYVLHM